MSALGPPCHPFPGPRLPDPFNGSVDLSSPREGGERHERAAYTPPVRGGRLEAPALVLLGKHLFVARSPGGGGAGLIGTDQRQGGRAQSKVTGRRPESRASDRRIPHISPWQPGVDGPARESASFAAKGQPISFRVHPRRPCRLLIGHAPRLTSEGRVMICQRCGKACVNRTEGRRFRLAGRDPFLCNVCSLHPVTAHGGGDRESLRDVPKAGPNTAQLRTPA
jgi:hypothetical protein